MTKEKPGFASRARVKFRLAGGAQPLILIPVQVNGNGPFTFILDTGAGTTLLTPSLANSAGVTITGTKRGQTAGGAVEVSLGIVDSFEVGALKHEKLDIAVHDLSHIGRAVGAQLDGDLGYNFFRDFRLTIDFASSELLFEDPRRCEYFGPPPLVSAPIQLAHPAKPLILVPVYLNERGPFQFAIDTGTSTSTISAAVARDLALQTQPMADVTTGGAPISMSAARADSLRIGQASIRDLDLAVGDFLEMLSQAVGRKLDGIVGYNFLRHFRVAIDYPNETLNLFRGGVRP